MSEFGARWWRHIDCWLLDSGLSLCLCLCLCVRAVDVPLCSVFDRILNSCLLSVHCSGSLIRSSSSSFSFLPEHISTLTLFRLPPSFFGRFHLSNSASPAFHITFNYLKLMSTSAFNCVWHQRKWKTDISFHVPHFLLIRSILVHSLLVLPLCPWRTGPQLEIQDVNRTVPLHSSSLTSLVYVSVCVCARKDKCWDLSLCVFPAFFVGTFFSWFCLRCGPNYFLHVKPLAITIKGRGRRDGKEEQTKGRVARRVVGQERPQVLADGVLYYMYAKHTDSVSHMYMHQGCSNLSFSDISGYSIFFIILKHFCVFRVIFLSSVTNVTALMGHIFQGCDQITHFLYFLPYFYFGIHY